jgi:hypothetical protein
MNTKNQQLRQAFSLLKRAIGKEQQPEPLNLALSRQLTRILSIVACRFDRVIEASITQHLQCLSDYQSIHAIPKVVFDHPIIGKHISNLLVRLKRNLKLSNEQLTFMDISCLHAEDYEAFDPDLFCVEACHPTSEKRQDDTVCEMLAPAFRWTDEQGQMRIKQGAIVAYMFEECEKGIGVSRNGKEKTNV